MNPSLPRLYSLFQQYKSGAITPMERQELMKMLSQPSYKEAVKELIAHEIDLLEELGAVHEHPLREERAAQIFNRIMLSGTENQGLSHSKNRTDFKNRKRWVWTAAAILILVASGSSYWIHTSSKKKPQPAVTQSIQNDIAPGGNKAVLTLANGSTIVLDSAQNGPLANQGGNNVVKVASGLLAYHQSSQIHRSPATTDYNVLRTPRGGQFQLVLPDGTKVWLNAESSIRFPTAFGETIRKVNVTGEVYFEVAPNVNRPFIVEANNLHIKVLGTHFNINAYSDEREITATLLEGSIQVTNAKASATAAKAIILQPGEQLQMKKDGESAVINHVDVDEVVAWKNGLFVLHRDDLYSIMRRLTRWYDVQVEYENGPARKSHFTGTIKRRENISKVLRMLELTGGARFEIVGRTIKVESH